MSFLPELSAAIQLYIIFDKTWYLDDGIELWDASGGDLEHGAQVLVAGHDVIEALGREKLLEDLGGQGNLPRRQRSLHLGKPILVSISRFEVKKNYHSSTCRCRGFSGKLRRTTISVGAAKLWLSCRPIVGELIFPPWSLLRMGPIR